MLSALLRLLRCFRQIVQNQTVIVREVLLHHALYVSGSDGLKSCEVGVNARRISQQDCSLSERLGLAVACFALTQLLSDDLVLRFLEFSG